MSAAVSPTYGNSQPEEKLIHTLWVSILFHAAFFALFLLQPHFLSQPPVLIDPMVVDLVSLSTGKSNPPPAGGPHKEIKRAQAKEEQTEEAGFSRIAVMLSAIPTMSPEGCKKPVSWSITISGVPPTRVATTG
ncbi:MAG: cell envelope integrity protein TolA, partial [Deltaproteobacteria bacterium]|nr:cell envelope integrity protein TolA [Deltaproteobacteria bacterium]